MKATKIFLLTTIGCFITPFLYADIYEWTDEDGVRHFTNSAPPPEAKIMIKTKELPYDESADRARRQADLEAQLELTRLEVVERTLALERRGAEAEQRFAEADRLAEETLREAEQLLNETWNERYDYRDTGYRGFYPHHHKKKYYYRNETASIHFTKRPYLKPHTRHHYKKYHYGHKDAYHRNKYHSQRFGYKEAYLRNKHYRSRSGSHRSRASIRSHSSSLHGRRDAGRIHSVSRSQRP